MKTTYCKFPIGGMCDGWIAECWQERVAFFVLALLHPIKYRLGKANGQRCIWWSRADTEAAK